MEMMIRKTLFSCCLLIIATAAATDALYYGESPDFNRFSSNLRSNNLILCFLLKSSNTFTAIFYWSIHHFWAFCKNYSFHRLTRLIPFPSWFIWSLKSYSSWRFLFSTYCIKPITSEKGCDNRMLHWRVWLNDWVSIAVKVSCRQLHVEMVFNERWNIKSKIIKTDQ